MMFENAIGQEPVKRKLSFYVKSFQKTKVMPFLCFNGPKGVGKTMFAREVGAYLKTDGEKRPFLEISCGTIRNMNQFMEQIYIPRVLDRSITCLFDECHELPISVTNSFLTIFNCESSSFKDFFFNDTIYPFNFENQSFFFATTEGQGIFPPLRDRLTEVSFSDYALTDLQEIIKKNVKEITIDEEALPSLAEMTRGNARGCVLLAKEVGRYCAQFQRKRFTFKDLRSLCYAVGLLPYGITSMERQVLQVLRSIGSCSLTMLAARLGASRSSVQKDYETYLLKRGFMAIDQKRYITTEGCNLIDSLKDSGL